VPRTAPRSQSLGSGSLAPLNERMKLAARAGFRFAGRGAARWVRLAQIGGRAAACARIRRAAALTVQVVTASVHLVERSRMHGRS